MSDEPIVVELREYIENDLEQCKLFDEEFPEAGGKYANAKMTWDYFVDCGMMGRVGEALAAKDVMWHAHTATLCTKLESALFAAMNALELQSPNEYDRIKGDHPNETEGM